VHAGMFPAAPEAPPVLDRLDALGRDLVAVTQDDNDWPEIGRRLESLLGRWRAARRGDHSGADLATASDQEIFELIDQELGAP
jgi:hypothetical protein